LILISEATPAISLVAGFSKSATLALATVAAATSKTFCGFVFLFFFYILFCILLDYFI